MEKLLNPVEARVLGSLIEKQITTPDYYPLTLSSLTNACNQKSNRNPVTDLNEQDVVRAIFGLRDKQMAWERAEAGARVMKYSHDISRTFSFTDPQLAVICELMLRGPQTVGELRTRCERMFPLGNIDEASAVVQSLADYPDGPLVVKLPREPGRRESRYAHLLCGEPEIELMDAPQLQPEAAVLAVRAENERLAELENTVQLLRSDVAALTQQFAQFKTQFE